MIPALYQSPDAIAICTNRTHGNKGYWLYVTITQCSVQEQSTTQVAYQGIGGLYINYVGMVLIVHVHKTFKTCVLSLFTYSSFTLTLSFLPLLFAESAGAIHHWDQPMAQSPAAKVHCIHLLTALPELKQNALHYILHTG